MESQSNGRRRSADMPELARWFYCHRCNGTTRDVTETYTCPTCDSGFIEEVTTSNFEEPDEDDSEVTMAPSMADALQALTSIMERARTRPDISSGRTVAAGRRDGASVGATASSGGQTAGQSDGGAVGSRDDNHQDDERSDPTPSDDAARGRAVDPSEFIQEFISNFMSGAVAGPSGTSNVRFFVPPVLQLHGNPGDYAWGPGGLDAIMTQFLNRMDGAGPPPMASEALKNLKKTKVTQDIIDKDAQCSVCWDDYVLDEEVTQLDCEHLFHDDCIVPWLKLHGTCPICRKLFDCDAGEAAATSEPGSSPDRANTSSNLWTGEGPAIPAMDIGNAFSSALDIFGFGSPSGQSNRGGDTSESRSRRSEGGSNNEQRDAEAPSSYADFDVE